MSQPSSLLLAAVVGATETVVVLYLPSADPREPRFVSTYVNASFPNLHALLQVFIDEARLSVRDTTCMLAGPDTASHTSPWTIDLTALASALPFRSVHRVSHLALFAAALPLLEETDMRVLQAGTPAANGPVALLASGPSFAQGFLIRNGQRYDLRPSDAGATLLAPTNILEQEILAVLQNRFGQVQYARVGGPEGLLNLYAALKQIGAAHEPVWLTEKLARSPNPAATIIDAAQQSDPSCSLCAATVERFLALLGTVAGGFASTVLATGGVYLGGEFIPRLAWMFDQDWFLEAFHQHGTGSALLHAIPVRAITRPDALLLGAVALGRELVL